MTHGYPIWPKNSTSAWKVYLLWGLLLILVLLINPFIEKALNTPQPKQTETQDINDNVY